MRRSHLKHRVTVCVAVLNEKFEQLVGLAVVLSPFANPRHRHPPRRAVRTVGYTTLSDNGSKASIIGWKRGELP